MRVVDENSAKAGTCVASRRGDLAGARGSAREACTGDRPEDRDGAKREGSVRALRRRPIAIANATGGWRLREHRRVQAAARFSQRSSGVQSSWWLRTCSEP
jgi:hypothetical protein